MMTPDASEISRMLADRIELLCRELLPHGRAKFGSWRVGSLDGEKGGSLSVKLRHRPGQWCDFATDEKGDALNLVRAVLGCDMAEALRWSRQWLGVESPTNGRERPRVDEEARRQREAERAAREALERKEEAERRKFALDLFDQAVDPHGTDTERYLAARRLELPLGADAIRHHPRCVFGGDHVQCMVALFRDNLTGAPIAIQRTKLPSGGWVRGMKMERLNFGPYGSGSIRIDTDNGDVLAGLARGAGVSWLRGLVIAEGLESGLALRKLGYRPVWATGGKGTIRRFPVLPEIQSLSAHCEPDAEADVRECLDRWAAAGRATIILRSRFGKDAADALFWEEL